MLSPCGGTRLAFPEAASGAQRTAEGFAHFAHHPRVGSFTLRQHHSPSPGVDEVERALALAAARDRFPGHVDSLAAAGDAKASTIESHLHDALCRRESAIGRPSIQEHNQWTQEDE